MAKHSRMLHFATGNGTDDVTLYTTLGEVVDPSLINEDQTTGGISLYTTGADTGYPALRMTDGGNTVYAPLVSPDDFNATNLKVRYNNTSYAVANKSTKPIGICLVQSGGGAGTWARIDGDGNPITTNPDFDNIRPWCDIHDVTVDGQAMVYIPNFYVKTGTLTSGVYSGKKYWLISKKELPGYHLHPAFKFNGQKKDGVYIAKYIAYNSGSNVPGSASNKTMWAYLSPSTARTYTASRNDGSSSGAKAGWHLWTVYEVGIIQMLALIECGTPDVQTAIAFGSGSNMTGNTSAVYRGISDAWYNYPPTFDGLRYSANGTASIWSGQNDGHYVETPAKAIKSNDQTIIEMYDEKDASYDLGDVFIPKSVGTRDNGTYGDVNVYYERGSAPFYVSTGGWAGRPDGSGLFYFGVQLGETGGDSGITFRMAKYDI